MKKLRENNKMLEKNDNIETAELKYINIERAEIIYKIKLLIIQNLGILIGFFLMVVMARFDTESLISG